MASVASWIRLFLVTMALSALACEPTPNYPPAMQPIVGHIELERSAQPTRNPGASARTHLP